MKLRVGRSRAFINRFWDSERVRWWCLELSSLASMLLVNVGGRAKAFFACLRIDQPEADVVDHYPAYVLDITSKSILFSMSCKTRVTKRFLLVSCQLILVPICPRSLILFVTFLQATNKVVAQLQTWHSNASLRKRWWLTEPQGGKGPNPRPRRFGRR